MTGKIPNSGRRAKSAGAPQLEREEESAPSLSIPPWFPCHLEETARSLHRQACERAFAEGEIVERVVIDPRMRSVWKELARRKRNPGERQIGKSPNKFVHQVFVPGWLLAEHPSADEEHQRGAIRQFFQFIVEKALLTLIRPLFREPGAFDPRGHHRNEAASLRSDAEILRKRMVEIACRRAAEVAQGLVSPEDPRREQQVMVLARAVTVLDELANETDWEEYNNKTLKGFVCVVGGRAKMLFGNPLIATTATIATVSFGQEVTPSRVRDIFRSMSIFGKKAG
jgi:hypothetical protein